MKISELIKRYLGVECIVHNEVDVDTLGLVASNLDKPFCTFVDSPKFIEDVPANAKMILTTKEIFEMISIDDVHFGICVVDNPRLSFFKLHNALFDSEEYKRSTFKTVIGNNCNISTLSSIAENNVVIGNNVIIEEFVVIRENTCIGDNCIIRSGAKIGGTDFEFKREGDSIFGVNHYGGVILGKNVEVQYNSGINKALYPWDDTVIGDYTKVDMLVHIAHGVKIGESCMIVANSGIGGRTVIGNNSWIGFASTIKNGLVLGDNVRVNMGAVVTKSVNSGESVTGNFAIEHSKFIENIKKSVL